MATTTAFGWATPDDTSLVKDGAAAIRTLGQSIDTSMSELKGGTTGQFLSKTSNTDMDFTWTAAGAKNFTLLSNATISGTTYTVSGLSGYDQFWVEIETINSGTASAQCQLRLNTDTGSNYDRYFTQFIGSSAYSANSLTSSATVPGTSVQIATTSNNTSSTVSGFIQIIGANTTGKKLIQYAAGATPAGGNSHQTLIGSAVYNSTSVISSISLVNNAGSWLSGTVKIYGSA